MLSDLLTLLLSKFETIVTYRKEFAILIIYKGSFNILLKCSYVFAILLFLFKLSHWKSVLASLSCVYYFSINCMDG